MPWYFPTAEQVLERGEGDCKARALILASIFEAKGIPYEISLSPMHAWVDYEGKRESSIENPEVKFYQRDPETGERWFQVPDIDPGEVLDSFWQGFWHPMPGLRKALLVLGLIALVTLRVTFLRTKTV